tara:strand:- start:2022 stop:2351 length:330 start_codon:yes stop_codon:yes gene_type:complete
MQPLREQEVGVSKGRDYQVSAWFEVKAPYDEQTGRYEPMQVSQLEAIEEALDTLRSVGANLKVTIKEKGQGEARQWPVALNTKVFINDKEKTSAPRPLGTENAWDRFKR